MDILYINIIESKFIIHSLAPACNWAHDCWKGMVIITLFAKDTLL